MTKVGGIIMRNLNKGLLLALSMSVCLPYTISAAETSNAPATTQADTNPTSQSMNSTQSIAISPPGYVTEGSAANYHIAVMKDGKVDTAFDGIFNINVTINNQHYTYTVLSKFEKGVSFFSVNIAVSGPVSIKVSIDKLGISKDLIVNVMSHSSSTPPMPPDKQNFWKEFQLGNNLTENQTIALAYDPVTDQYVPLA
jgi:hypothetical protein